MRKTDIEWVKNPDGSQGYTWNPVTGCYHGCSYCYARGIVTRFGVNDEGLKSPEGMYSVHIHDDESKEIFGNALYPFGFEPTFYPDRLNALSEIKKPTTIFVGSMGDIWGDWVTDDWLAKLVNVLYDRAVKCPCDRVLLLTKNPKRYHVIADETHICVMALFIGGEVMWYGASITTIDEAISHSKTMSKFKFSNKYFSAEPLLEDIADHIDFTGIRWLIIGALMKNGRVVPPEKGGTQKQWVKKLIETARASRVPYFLKDSIINIWPELTGCDYANPLPYLEGEI
ncbi:MAG: phage Gp37/Gp68 family protein [Nitrospirota bacterium]